MARAQWEAKKQEHRMKWMGTLAVLLPRAGVQGKHRMWSSMCNARYGVGTVEDDAVWLLSDTKEDFSFLTPDHMWPDVVV